ncbi:MAG: BlaI/MecI/CopY family transcriptional regulator [Pygmaiobacter sp.]|nr:BlaI/MecI/CopY family transcriptional regulator [Pygmaiobacter sp.]
MKLSATEYEIMQRIWAKDGPATSGDLSALSTARGWKAPTVLTFLKRMCEKGLLATEKRGKMRFYTPLLSKEAYAREETQSLVNELYGGKMSNLIASLTEQGSLSAADCAELKKILDGEWK